MKKVLVTGANGFIGSALCRGLSEKGISVIAVVGSEDDNIETIKDIHNLAIIYCDISNFKNLSKYIKARDVDVLYHFAWVGSAGSLRGDIDVQLHNVQYTCDVV